MVISDYLCTGGKVNLNSSSSSNSSGCVCYLLGLINVWMTVVDFRDTTLFSTCIYYSLSMLYIYIYIYIYTIDCPCYIYTCVYI